MAWIWPGLGHSLSGLSQESTWGLPELGHGLPSPGCFQLFGEHRCVLHWRLWVFMLEMEGWYWLHAFLSGWSSTPACTAETGWKLWRQTDRQTDLGSSPASPLCSWVSVQVQHVTESPAKSPRKWWWACLHWATLPRPPFPRGCAVLPGGHDAGTVLNQSRR